jgi:hypothetical protein
MLLTMNERGLLGHSHQVVHETGFQYLNEVSGPIEPLSRDATLGKP